MPDWFFTSDLHGQTSLYEQLLAIVAARRPAAVLRDADVYTRLLRVVDHVSGMTDNYLVRRYRELSGIRLPGGRD